MSQFNQWWTENGALVERSVSGVIWDAGRQRVLIIRIMGLGASYWELLKHKISHQFRQSMQPQGLSRQHLKAFLSCRQRAGKAEDQKNYIITRMKEKTEFSTSASLLLQNNSPDWNQRGLDILEKIIDPLLSMASYYWISWIKKRQLSSIWINPLCYSTHLWSFEESSSLEHANAAPLIDILFHLALPVTKTEARRPTGLFGFCKQHFPHLGMLFPFKNVREGGQVWVGPRAQKTTKQVLNAVQAIMPLRWYNPIDTMVSEVNVIVEDTM